MTARADGRRLRDPAPVLWSLTALGWVAVVVLSVVPAPAAGAAAGGTAAVAGFAAGWLVMVAASMLPTTVPVARMFTVVSSRQQARGPVLVAFFAAYVAVWSAFGLVAAGLAAGLDALVRGLVGTAAPGVVLAAALALAGAFQFSALKKRCLTQCREPMAFLFAHYRRGLGGAWRLGQRHAVSCLGCCWALMLVMTTAGMADLTLMLGLTAVMVVEKTTAWGDRISWWVGAALLGVAVLVALTPGGAAAGHLMG